MGLRLFVRKVLCPAMYHGHRQSPPFFEGWYYKLVSADQASRYAVIPGVLLGENGHAFIQVLDGTTGQSACHTFPLADFEASERDFYVRIGSNHFSQDRLVLNIDDALGQVSGQVHLEGTTPWPVSWLAPGIMGWYAWAPGMECYHGVLSFDHTLHGTLTVDGRRLDWAGGRGYIEKDWGQSFPSAWVWFQSNHFEQPGACITASVAIIPWLGRSFRGFIAGLWHERVLYRFATWSGARMEKLEIGDTWVDWVMRDRRYRLELLARRAEGGVLLGPTRTEMGKRVAETLRAEVHVRLTRLAGEVLFEGDGRHAGLEVHGELDRLLDM